MIGRALSKQIGLDLEWAGSTYPGIIPGLVFLDINDPKNIKKVFENTKPDYVIHCANLSGGVDFCEKNPEAAKKFHFDATVAIGRQCLTYNAKFIFLSSECVFDGKKVSYNEDDQPHPLNVYGKWKAKSEEWIRGNLKNYLIVRTMAVYGWDPKTSTPNALMKLYFSISQGKEVFAPVFRWSAPTYVEDLAKAIKEVCVSGETGMFHITGSSFLSRYEWLKTACNVLGWDSSLLLRQDRPSKTMAPRPYKVNLDTDKFSTNFKTKLHSLEEGLVLMRENILRHNKEERILR